MELWTVILAAGAITFLTRLSFVAAHGRVYPPALLTRALRFVPVAVLSAIILPELMVREGQISPSVASPKLIAGIIAAFVAWRSKNVWLTIGVGMAVLLILQAVPSIH